MEVYMRETILSYKDGWGNTYKVIHDGNAKEEEIKLIVFRKNGTSETLSRHWTVYHAVDELLHSYVEG